MATTPPALGYGNRSEASIDSVNQWMRATPWYQSLIRSFGQDPSSVHLTDNQKQQVIKAAQANGVVVDEGGNGQEVDDSGNFRAKGHGLRNTLIVAGLAGAALATAGAAGLFAGAAAPAAAEGGVLASTATVPAVGALAAGGSGLVAGAGTSALAGTAAAAGTAGLSYADLLKYGLPVAGNLIGGVIQANATGAASDAQQKYLQEALDYQKEQDAYTRTRQAGLDAQEVQRYGDYQGRIAPFIANGTNSNDRMAALLGLPPRAGGSSGGPAPSQGVPVDAATQAAIRAELKAANSNDDPAAWDTYVSSHGDSSVKNWDYWKNRIDTGDGVGKGYAGATTPASAPPAAAPTSPTAPAVSAAAVQMRAPDGSVKSVPSSEVPHWQALGATVLQGAA